jgi:hypothetical protein
MLHRFEGSRYFHVSIHGVVSISVEREFHIYISADTEAIHTAVLAAFSNTSCRRPRI